MNGTQKRESEAAAKTAAGRPHQCAEPAAAERIGRQRASELRALLALAREATLNGDTVEAENFYQHAEHYFRVTRDRTN